MSHIIRNANLVMPIHTEPTPFSIRKSKPELKEITGILRLKNHSVPYAMAACAFETRISNPP